MNIAKKALRRHFDPRLYPNETYLLCELKWRGGARPWTHWVRNYDCHAEVYFLDKIFEPRNYGFCDITWYLSFSPCWSCCNEILDFLRRHHNVKINIRVARLFHTEIAENRKGLRELHNFPRVTLRVMDVRDYRCCRDTFIQRGVYCDFSPESFEPAIRRYRAMLEDILGVEKGNNIMKEKLILIYKIKESRNISS